MKAFVKKHEQLLVITVAVLVAVFLLVGCSSMTPEDKSKVVDAALEAGKTAWCLDLGIIAPICAYKNKTTEE